MEMDILQFPGENNGSEAPNEAPSEARSEAPRPANAICALGFLVLVRMNKSISTEVL